RSPPHASLFPYTTLFRSPALYTWPSRQYVVAPASLHATQAASRDRERGTPSPAVARMNAPVPYVHLASPGAKQDSANSAACWSTTSPATGSGSPNTVVSPTDAAQSTISGWVAGSISNSAQASSDQVVLSRSSNNVL